MKKNLLILLTFLPLAVFAQNNELFKIDSVPKEGIELDKGWKWHAGDNPDFAKSDFNDSLWEEINPVDDIKELPQLWETDINWLRFYLYADSNNIATMKTYLLEIQQNVASEIFLNGKMIGGYGKIDKDNKKTIAISPGIGNFVGLPITSKGRYVLAVRLAIQKNIHYVQLIDRPNNLFFSKILESKNISSAIQERNILPYEFSRFGMFIILTFLHLGLYFFNPSQKSNLYFSIFTLLTAIPLPFLGLLNWQTSPIIIKFQIFSIVYITALLYGLMLVMAVYCKSQLN